MIEHSFVKRFTRLVTGQHFIHNVATLYWWQTVLAGVGAASSLFSGFKSSSALREGGQLARDAAYANASDLRDLASFNASGYREAGAINAGAIRTVGEANALAVENATARNMVMYGMQADEDRRRHVISQKMTAGQIRAMAGASGVQTNTGSPLHYLNAQVSLGIRERRFGDIKAYWTLRNMYEEGTEKAAVIRLTADQQAMVTEYNANLQAEMSYAEHMRQATAMERSGDIGAQIANAQGSAAMWGGISNAISTGANLYTAFGGLSPSPTGATTTGAYGSFTGTYSQSNTWGLNNDSWYLGGSVGSDWGRSWQPSLTTSGAY